jgi:ABC-type transport system involved in cytochrome bd biosynthesis fused ATPase/permease subunit
MAKVLDVCDDRGLLVNTHDAAELEGFDRVLRLQHGSIASEDARRAALALL